MLKITLNGAVYATFAWSTRLRMHSDSFVSPCKQINYVIYIKAFEITEKY